MCQPGASSRPEDAAVADIVEGFAACPKTIPCRLLYDDRGSQLYARITGLTEYTPYRAELSLLQQRSTDIAKQIAEDAVIVELGCGDCTKTAHLVNSLMRVRSHGRLTFCALDVSAEALRQTRDSFATLCPESSGLKLELVQAEYVRGVEMIRERFPGVPLCLLWLGSSIGNFPGRQAINIMGSLLEAAGHSSQMLLGTDLWKDNHVLRSAYNDSGGVTRDFIINGVLHALGTLGHDTSDSSSTGGAWEYQVAINDDAQQVEMFAYPETTVHDVLPGVDIVAGERVLVEVSRKFTDESIGALVAATGMVVQEALRLAWRDTKDLMSHVRDWGIQPIALRHPFCFYPAHITAFALLKLLPWRTPTVDDVTYSRGIDPNVTDPTVCHGHPDAPEVWPSQQEVEEYLASGQRTLLDGLEHAPSAQFMHALCMTLEHERLHQETLCYMMAQARRDDFLNGTQTLRAPSRARRAQAGSDSDTAVLLRGARTYAASSLRQVPPVAPPTPGAGRGTDFADFVRVPGGKVVMGISQQRAHGFVWDNEMGQSDVATVPNLLVRHIPVTVAEYRRFVVERKGYGDETLWEPTAWKQFCKHEWRMPAGWCISRDNEIYVAAAEKMYHWEEVAECPVLVSLAEAAAYCKHVGHGARIMTEPEYVHIRSSVEAEGCKQQRGWAPKVWALDAGGWEWTSSEFLTFNGFEADGLYPEYSTDFSDGEHFALRGSSPYTHPSCIRPSFRNFYQSMYPYVAAKFRMVIEV